MSKTKEVNFEFSDRCDYIININPKTKKIMETTNHFKYNIIEIANKIEGQRNKSKHHLPYNVFTAWKTTIRSYYWHYFVTKTRLDATFY